MSISPGILLSVLYRMIYFTSSANFSEVWILANSSITISFLFLPSRFIRESSLLPELLPPMM